MINQQYAILWDMDGTLIDTTDMHMESWVKALARYGKKIQKTETLEHFGKNNRSITPLFFPDASPELVAEISDQKEVDFRDLVPGNTTVYPGVLEWLKYFQSKGIIQSIASSAPMENIDVLLDETGIREYFDYIGSGAYIPGKPDPTLFLNVSDALKISPQNCLVIEDAPAGIMAAMRAKMPCVAITNSRPASDLTEAKLIIREFSPAALQQVETMFLV